MASDPNISPDFVTQHARAAAWLIGSLLTLGITLTGVFLRSLAETFKKATDEITFIKDIQGLQASNHLSHIEQATGEMRDAQIQTNAKLDVLIQILEKK